MSIRKALGAVKDQTSISIAKVSSAVAPEVDVLVVKATSHDDEPAEERHVREILSLTERSLPHVSACTAALVRRLHKTRDWVVALKSLSLLHRLLSVGHPSFRQHLLHSRRPRPLHIPDFRDEAHSSSWDHSAFVRTYSLYLDHLLHSPNQLLGPPSSSSSSSPAHRPSSYSYDDDDHRRYRDDDRRSPRRGERTPPRPVKELPTEALLERTRDLQQLLERFLACRPTGRAKSSRLVLIELYPLVKDSFRIYADLSELLGVLLDRFPDLDYADGAKAFDAYANGAKQVDELIAFYIWCKETGIARSSEYPEVERVADKLLESLEDLMRDKGRNSRTPENGRKDRAVVVEPAVKEEPVQDMNSIKALPAPEGYEDRKQDDVDREREKKQPPPPPPQPEKAPDLVDLRDNSVTADSQGNQLALALFSAPGTGGGSVGNGSWEAFPSDDPQVTSAWQTPAAESGKADWELALVEDASKLAKQKATLGGGFDPVLLDGMYDQGVVRHQVSAQMAGGSSSSVALPGPGRGASPVLALPAPDGTVQTIGQDPFAASLAVPPPSYVQMVEIEKKQQLLVQEQQLWQQYSRDGMQGQVSLAKLSLAPQNPGAMAMPYGMPPVNGGYYYGP